MNDIVKISSCSILIWFLSVKICVLHKPWIKTKRKTIQSNQSSYKYVFIMSMECECEWKFNIVHTQFTRNFLRVLSMNLSFVCVARDLILDENLCDYHSKFMLCRRQLAAIHCWRLMEKFQTLAHTTKERNVKIYFVSSRYIPSNRTKSWAPLKIRRVTHKRFGTKSFFFGFVSWSGPRFLSHTLSL